MKIVNTEEGLEYELDVRITNHALRDRWFGREQLDTRIEGHPADLLTRRIELSSKLQEQLALLVADGDYNALCGDGIPVGFEFVDNFFMCCSLKEDRLTIVTINDTIVKRVGQSFIMKKDEIYFDKKDTMHIVA